MAERVVVDSSVAVKWFLRDELEEDVDLAAEILAAFLAGEILEKEFLKPMVLSQNRLAKDIGVSPRRINEIILGKRRITADTSLRLAKYFNMSPQFWLGLQMDFDLDVESDRLGIRLNSEVGRYSKAK